MVAIKTLDEHIDRETGKYLSSTVKKMGAQALPGFQMKYIYYFDKELEARHPSVSFDEIPDEVRMYKGKKYAAEAEG